MRHILAIIALLNFGLQAVAQYDVSYTNTAGPISWTVPNNPCVTEYTFEAWGGGANGNPTTGSGVEGGGAGGYARVTVTGVTPGQIFTINVGAGGVNGGSSTVVDPTNTTILTATGGTGQNGGNGTITIGTNPYTSTGGNGANGVQPAAGVYGSGGGGGAGGLGVNGVTPADACCWANGYDGQWSAGGGGRGNGGSGGAGAFAGNYLSLIHI